MILLQKQKGQSVIKMELMDKWNYIVEVFYILFGKVLFIRLEIVEREKKREVQSVARRVEKDQ